MIEGLKVRLPGSKVISLAIERVQEHERKAAKYETAGESIREADGDEDIARTSMDPRSAVKAKVKEHTTAAAFWQMIADYTVVGEEYQLQTGEVKALLGQERVY